ncbi:MAG: tyrosine-protein phosphatase [Prevotella sp.]|nr:tyrosine-protein phosphatase [Prevotella sp.]
MMSVKYKLNLRDLGGIPTSNGKEVVSRGLYLRSGKLSVLGKEKCAKLCKKYNIACVIDLRTPTESAEFPDPIMEQVEFVQIPLLKDAAVGITHETGSDAMTIVRNLRKQPEKLKEMVPDFKSLYTDIVTDEYCRAQLDKAVAMLRANAEKGRCTLFHCTEGKDRSGLVSMALLKSYGVSDKEIVRDYMLTNRNAFLPTIKKCLGVALLTRNWDLVKTAYHSFLADRRLIELAIKLYGEAK